MDNIMPGGIYRYVDVSITGSSHKPPSRTEMHDRLNVFYYDLKTKAFNPEDEIIYMTEIGIINGHDDGKFRPDENITNVEFYTIINILADYEKKVEPKFRDVKEIDWFYETVEKALGADYIENGEYLYPNDLMTREEAARIITTVYDLPLNAKAIEVFKDWNKTSMDKIGYVGALSDKGYISGYEDETFRPKGNITRAEVAMMLYKVMMGEGRPEIVDPKKEETSTVKDGRVSTDTYVETTYSTAPSKPEKPEKPIEPEEPEKPEEPEEPEEPTELEEAEKAVEGYEDKVNTRDKVLDLVNDDELRNEVSKLKTIAFNKIQLVNPPEKQDLLDRLDIAHNKLIAATAVKGLQNATENLTEENLDNAKIKLSNAKTNVRFLDDRDIKDALNDLIAVEENKIKSFEDKDKTEEELAREAVEDFEAKVNSVTKVKSLVEDDGLRQKVSASFTPAFNKIQELSGEDKENLLNSLNAANDIVIATSFVSGLQETVDNLKEETLTGEDLFQAKIKLTSAKGNVSSLPEGDIKDALMELIEIEEAKIDNFGKQL